MNPDSVLSTSRVLPFSRDAIYGAFASAPMLARWWGPEGFTNTFERFEFQPDGQWIFTMHGPDGRSYFNTSRFVSLEPGRQVVIRHDCAPLFTLSVGLADAAGGTLLTWDQAFDDPQTAQAVKAIVGSANEENLDRLTCALATPASAAPAPAPVADELPPLPSIPLGRYRHYKGGEYEVLGVVRHSESLEPMVLYRPLRADIGAWVRPFAMFLEPVEHAGVVQSRFRRIEAPASAEDAVPKAD